MQDKALKRDIESAALVIENYQNLENNKGCKNKFIKDVFNSQGRDSDYGGTRVRINALLRIVRSNKIIEALEYIIDSDRINKDDPKAVEMAKEALIKIKSK